jgi:hypothetical protein
MDFSDENDDPVVPATLRWSMKDPNEETVNGRLNVDVAVPTNPFYLVLSGDDLALEDGKPSRRKVIFEATYNSALGNGLPLNECAEFTIESLLKIN